ncbi:MAG: aspartate kinase [Kordiimonadaceae bacterium]|jgi:aspartate kinase|nr:aspartate kinase [Kordiimonadaceae bacterium]MBT6467749.1 aspartate kinase [Kordiimonadaceae bacterium]MBT7605147.1 aspartate kinase [Kordiimonadaceae bacterium]MDB4044486.1 aspartate kinase [Emcibacteraceae bacterium]MDC1428991.1 aspartate kinase [Emcibacteraceae bacterium]
MSRIVMKFGGTSVANLECIRNVALRVKKEVDQGNQVSVFVSAMAGTTDKLVGWVEEISPLHDAREYDTVVSAGEQITSGLLALALQDIGVPARSWLGWQVPFKTNQAHSAAQVEEIEIEGLTERLIEGTVCVIAGFQGISIDNRITTLGRGGSDTSAVALAAAIGANRCDIYTDVEGVFTADPRIVPSAQKLEKVTYEEMLEMASLGAKVLQTRSVVMAMNHKVRVQVLSSFTDKPGTLLIDEDEIVENKIVSGITYAKNEAQVMLVGVKNNPGIASDVFKGLANENINVDMIIQNETEGGRKTDITFTVAENDAAKAEKILNEADNIDFKKLITDMNVAKISVIGVGMRSHSGVAATMFETLADRGINIQVISTSEIKISVLIEAAYTELAVRSLHTAYGLDSK